MRLANFLRFSDEHLLVEQIRLLLSHSLSSLISAALIAILLILALKDNGETRALPIWGLSLLVWNSVIAIYGHLRLKLGIQPPSAKRFALELVFLFSVEGMIWGALPWAAIDGSNSNVTMLIIAVAAAAAGSALPLLSPILPVFIAFASLELAVLVSRLLAQHDHFYNTLALGSMVYVGYLFTQAINSSKTIRDAINLRFENALLVEKLRIETEVADAAKREAESANTAKSKFLAAASHDLRQPVHAQGLFLETLARTDLTPHQRELVSNARAASEASSELLNALLDFSRIEAGVVEPYLQDFRLQPLLNKIENELAPQADAKNIVYRSRETPLSVCSDQILLESILRNLVSNAIRYTKRGGVLVGCRQHQGEAILEVWDTGIGIPTEYQREIFREFYQLGNPERDRSKGLGLGLAISEGLARTLGHRITLASIPGKGSVFRLHLPIKADPSGVVQSHLQSKTRVLNARILVIEDEVAVRNGMKHLLHDWGCICDTADSIEEALTLARQHRPDVVISDYRLRNQLTGIEAISSLRGLFGSPLPALMITGDTAPERLREAQASGIPLLHKPVAPARLYKALAELLQEHPPA
jgi:signal transduction histidine kinase